MALSIKIHGGTPHLGKSLCHTCKNAKIVKGQNCEERIVCGANLFSRGPFSDNGVVTFRVSECSKFHPINMPWLHEMEEMAWTIEARRRGEKGFRLQEGEGEMQVVITRPSRESEE